MQARWIGIGGAALAGLGLATLLLWESGANSPDERSVAALPSAPGATRPARLGAAGAASPGGESAVAGDSMRVRGQVLGPDGGSLRWYSGEHVLVSGCGVAQLPVGADGVFDLPLERGEPCELRVSRVRGGARSLGDATAVDPTALPARLELIAPAAPPWQEVRYGLEDLPTADRAQQEQMLDRARHIMEETLADPNTSAETRARLEEILQDLDE